MDKPTIIEKFGGLDLRDDLGEAGITSAIQMSNVDVDLAGRIRTRNGYSVFVNNAAATTRRYRGIFPTNQRVILLPYSNGASIGIDALSPLATISAPGSIALAGASVNSIVGTTASIGVPAGSRSYITAWDAIGSQPTALVYYNGAALVAPAGAGRPGFVAVSPRSNRLVQGYYPTAAVSPSGANGSTSTVWFSDANNPDVWGATNFVNLRPGDGEQIVGMVTWRDLLFVFKNTRMFVFYGETPDDDGLPIFNYREVSLPTSLESIPGGPPNYAQSIVVGASGVYYATADGIYTTTGSIPKRISDQISTIWGTTGDPYLDVNAIDRTFVNNAPMLQYVNGMLIATYHSILGNTPWLVWDEQTRAWRMWLMSAALTPTLFMPTRAAAFSPDNVIGTFPSTDVNFPATFIVSGQSDGNVYIMSRAEDDDNGTAINWFYQSGFSDLGTPGEKRIRFIDLYGSGTVSAQTMTQGGRALGIADTPTAVTLGTLPDIARARRYGGARGRLIGHKLLGSGRAVVSRLEYRYTEGLKT